MQRLEAIVHGRVQGVMYRDFACRKGRGLQLVGSARNLPNGTVEVIAEGNREDLERYVERLRHGPLLAKVTAVETSWKEVQGTFSSFSILFN